jgi:hypothetical protein
MYITIFLILFIYFFNRLYFLDDLGMNNHTNINFLANTVADTALLYANK